MKRRLTVMLEDDLIKKFKISTLTSGHAPQEIIEELISQYLNNDKVNALISKKLKMEVAD